MSQARTWKCEVCGYIHHGERPPEQCPVCGVGAEMFSLFEVVEERPSPAAKAWRCTICDHVHDGDAPPKSCPLCGAEQSLFEPHEPPERAAAASSDRRRILVLGAGIAGVTAAEHARMSSTEAVITLISKEPEPPYYRLNLTRFLAGEVAEDSLALQPASWYEAQRIELFTGTVTAIDRQAQAVELEGGRQLEYDRLVLATGAHPFVPPIAGTAKTGVFVLRTKADALAILEKARSGARCACLGGGVLGLEAAGALRARGARVTVLEGFDWLLPRQLAEPAGQLLQEALEAQGIQVRCGVRAKEIVGDEEARGIRLEGDEIIDADLVLLSTGVRPNSYLARTAGLDVSRGVIVDDAMTSSDPHIYAAGDVAEHRGVVYGIWPASYAQGLVAGTNAAGGGRQFPGLPPSHRLKVQGIDLFSIGEFEPSDGSYAVVERRDGPSYLRLAFHDGRLVGANLFGDTALAGPIKTYVEQGTQIVEQHELLGRFDEVAALR